MRVLVFLEQRSGELKSSSLEALRVANDLTKNPSDVFGVLVGGNLDSISQNLKNKGLGNLLLVEDSALELYNPESYLDAFAQAFDEVKPQVVLGMASPMGRDLFPRLSVRKSAGLLTDLVAVRFDDKDFLGGTKPMYAGKVLADVLYENCAVKMATLRPNVFPGKDIPAEPKISKLSFVKKSSQHSKTLDIKKGVTKKVDLTEATRIISGGRSLGSSDNFKILHELADKISATVGASRAAVDAGYATHDMQVGQTGKTVNPTLYIACGISGAIQHMAGMKTSKIIVAINLDPQAPIFAIADYGIVGDLFEVVPMLTKKLQSLL